MKRYVEFYDDFRIKASSDDTELPNGILMDIPDDFLLERQHEYKLINGALVVDPIPDEIVVLESDIIMARLDYLSMMVGVES